MTHELRFSTLLLLVLGMALATAAFYQPLPPWMPLPLLGLVWWRLWPAWQGRSCPVLPQAYKVLTLVLLSLLLWSGGRLGLGISGAGALFIVLLWSKLLELHDTRSLNATCAIALFLVAAQLLEAQSLLECMFALLSSLVLLSVLVHVHLVGLRSRGSPDPQQPWSAAWRAQRIVAVMTLQALPFAWLLFICLPRPSIGQGMDTHTVRSGFTDHIEPGSVAELALSNEPAFRVSFDTPRPATGEMYWRGLVLWTTDGARWSRRGTLGTRRDPTLPQERTATTSWKYEITMLPTNMRWIYTLDCPLDVEPESHAHAVYLRQPGTVFDGPVVSATRVFRGTSSDLPAIDRPAPEYAAPPPDLDPGVAQLAGQLALESGGDPRQDPEQAVQAILHYFQSQHFVYTLHPGDMGPTPTGTFLFERKRGFCEHYASACAILLRCMGLCSRVVVGYCGGEWNPVGNFLTVRQSNAHAWCEVYVAGKGWDRVDPTTVVEVQDDEGNLVPNAEATDARSLSVSRASWFGKHLTWLSQRWDVIEAKWDHWALTYDHDSLVSQVSQLGLGRQCHAGPFVLLFGLGLPFVLLLLVLLRRRRPSGDAVQDCYRRLCDTLAAAGCARHPDEGPITFAQRAGIHLPEQREAILAAAELYVEMRYGPVPAPDQMQERLQRLRARIAKVRPGARLQPDSETALALKR